MPGENAGEIPREKAGEEGLSMPVSVLKYVRTSTFNFDGVADSRVLLNSAPASRASPHLLLLCAASLIS